MYKIKKTICKKCFGDNECEKLTIGVLKGFCILCGEDVSGNNAITLGSDTFDDLYNKGLLGPKYPNEYIKNAQFLLGKLKQYPQMFASDRESFVSFIVGVLYVLGYKDTNFYIKLHETKGCVFVDLDKEVDKKFAEKSINLAQEIIKDLIKNHN